MFKKKKLDYNNVKILFICEIAKQSLHQIAYSIKK